MLMKNKSPKLELLKFQYFYGTDTGEVISKIKMIKESFTNYNLVLIPYQYSYQWWNNVFVKLTIDSYMLIIFDSLKGRNINIIVQVKNILIYFGKRKMSKYNMYH